MKKNKKKIVKAWVIITSKENIARSAYAQHPWLGLKKDLIFHSREKEIGDKVVSCSIIYQPPQQ